MLRGMSTALAASLQLQIDALDLQLLSVQPTSVGADGVSRTNVNWVELSKRRNQLQAFVDRLSGTGPMLVRGRVKGIGHGRA